ncbi:hypothetical protein [Paracoccus sp. ME4]|uniref:hypothetical protein n=1 Tax=Paracoccus sp. ME4 TaxID=3138066 RepID=UPI00398AE19E
MLIIHEPKDGARRRLPQSLLDSEPRLALAGPVDAFDGAGVAAAWGRVGGPVLRFTHVGAPRTAFAVLHDCAALCRPLLAETFAGLRYVQPRGETLPDAPAAGQAREVAWSHGADGMVAGFALAPLVASSPLLLPLLRQLAAAPLSDEVRFAHLGAAFAGY